MCESEGTAVSGGRKGRDGEAVSGSWPPGVGHLSAAGERPLLAVRPSGFLPPAPSSGRACRSRSSLRRVSSPCPGKTFFFQYRVLRHGGPGLPGSLDYKVHVFGSGRQSLPLRNKRKMPLSEKEEGQRPSSPSAGCLGGSSFASPSRSPCLFSHLFGCVENGAGAVDSACWETLKRAAVQVIWQFPYLPF